MQSSHSLMDHQSCTGLSQDQYGQLVVLLQQANVLTSSNDVSVSSVIHGGHSPHDISFLCLFYC
jgi:hypothetical protein